MYILTSRVYMMYACTTIDIMHLVHAHIVYVRTCTVYSICIRTCVARTYARVPAHVRCGPPKKICSRGGSWPPWPPWIRPCRLIASLVTSTHPHHLYYCPAALSHSTLNRCPRYCIAGNFRGVQLYAVFADRPAKYSKVLEVQWGCGLQAGTAPRHAGTHENNNH